LRFGEIESDVLEKTCSAFWRNHVRRFGEIVFGVLEKSCSAFWRNRLVILEIWRTLFGEIVVGDLEKSCSAFWRIRSVILEIVMEYRNASVTVRGDRKLKGKNGDKLWRPKLYSS